MGSDRRTPLLVSIVLLIDSIFFSKAGAYQAYPYSQPITPPPAATLSHETNRSYKAWRQIFDKLNLRNATIVDVNTRDFWTMPQTCRLNPCGYVHKDGSFDTCYSDIYSPNKTIDDSFIDYKCASDRDMPTDNCAKDHRAGVICNSKGEIVVVDLSFFDFKLPLVLLPAEIGGLSKLKQLWLIGGNFSNSIPPTIVDLKELVMANFQFNNFRYPLQSSLKALCIQKPMFGLIPSLKIPSLQDTGACTAFGGNRAIPRLLPNEGCRICNLSSTENAIITIVFLLSILVIILIAKWYRSSNERYPDAVKATAASMSIIFSQGALTRVILVNMNLRWPRKVKQVSESVTSFVSLDLLNTFGVECFLVDLRARELNTTLITLCFWGVSILVLFLVVYGTTIFKRIASKSIINKYCCRTCNSSEKRSKQFDSLANFVGIGLSVCGTSFIKYLTFDSNLRQGLSPGDWGRVFVPKILLGMIFFKYCRETLYYANLWDGSISMRKWVCLKKLQVPKDRLARRLNFISRRFDKHAAYWQFVVWLRQLSMVILTNVTSNCIEIGVFSIIILLGFLWLHYKVRPFVYNFQNLVERYLLLSCIIIILFGTIYCAVDIWVDEVVNLIITIAVLGTLFASFLGSLYYLGIFQALREAYSELWNGENTSTSINGDSNQKSLLLRSDVEYEAENAKSYILLKE